MASTNKTSLGLPKWVLSDKPDMKDFNDAFEKIDGELEKKVNVGQPEIYDIQFVEGLRKTRKSYYYKTPFNQVHVYIACTGKLRKNQPITTLPQEFWPIDTHQQDVTVYDSSGALIAGQATIYVDANTGDIMVSQYNLENGLIVSSLCYIAAQ